MNTFVANILSTILVLPFTALTLLFTSIFDYYSYPDEDNDSKDLVDRWYVFSFSEMTGGSLLQFVVTQSVFWRFSKIDDTTYKVRTAPRIWYGKLFSILINYTSPNFKIQKLKDFWKIRLQINNTVFSENTLLDIWKIHEEGKIIQSLKLRGMIRICGLTFFGIGTGKATFVSNYKFKDIDSIL